MLLVHHYGAHVTEGGIGLLVQEAGVQHALDVNLGLAVKVQKPRRNLYCPHDINLGEGSEIKLASDPVLDAFLPIPKGLDVDAVCLPDDEHTRQIVSQAMRLTSPKGGAGMHPLWLLKPAVLMDQLQLTNIQPLVLYGYHPTHHSRMTKLMEAARFAPRRLIILLPEMMWLAQPHRRKTSLSPTDLEKLPLERIGSSTLRQYLKSQNS